MITYLIDAYNVLHRHPGLKALLRKDFDGARDRFVSQISGFALRGKNQIILVFDGRKDERRSGAGRLKIVFAEEEGSADRVIKRLIDKSKNPRNLVVVSSDTEVANYGRLNACRILSAEEFIAKLEDAGGETNEKPESENKTQREEWMKLFSEKRRDRSRDEG